MSQSPKIQSGKILHHIIESRRQWILWLVLVGVLTALLCAPFFRAIYWTGDEGVLLSAAQRLMSGQRLYADFFQMLPPGGYLLTEGWLRLFGVTLWSARMFAVVTLVGITCFTFLACWQVSRNSLLSAFITMAWMIATQPWLSFIAVNYHSLATLFSVIAAWATLYSIDQPQQRQSLWPLIAGIAAGMATMIMQTGGAAAMLAGIVAYLNVRRFRSAFIIYIIGSLSIPLCALIYIFATQAAAAAFDNIILFALYHYTSIQSVPYGMWSIYTTRPLVLAFPIAAVMLGIIGIRDGRKCLHDRTLCVSAAFAFAGFITTLHRPDIFHIAMVVPLACPLLAYGVIKIAPALRPAYRIIIACAVILLGIPSVLSYGNQMRTAIMTPASPTPAGDAKFLAQPGTAEVLAHIAATPAQDTYFFYPYMPMMPFLADRVQRSKIDIFTPQFTQPYQYQEACVAVMQQATWVVIDRHWTDTEWLKIVFPAMQDASPPETRRFEAALDAGFELVKQEATFEIRRRRDDADTALCDGITQQDPH